MSKKDKALAIVDKLFELNSNDISVSFSSHCREMVISADNLEDGSHWHISDHVDFSDQLSEIIVALYDIEKRLK